MLDYAIRSGRWVNNLDIPKFRKLADKYAGSIDPAIPGMPPLSTKTYVIVEFMDMEDFEHFDQVAYRLFEEDKPLLSRFQRVIKRLKNLI